MSIIKKIKEKVLNLSDSYLFYKNYYHQNENLKDINHKLESIEDINHKLESIEDINHKLGPIEDINHKLDPVEDINHKLDSVGHINKKLEQIQGKMDSNYIRFDELLNYDLLEINNNLNNRLDDVKINQNIQYYNLINFFEKSISSLEKKYLNYLDEYMSDIEEIFEKNNVNNEESYNELLKECSYLSNKIKQDNKILYNMVENDFDKLNFNQESFERVVSEKIDDLNDSVLSINKLRNNENTNDLLIRLNNLEKILTNPMENLDIINAMMTINEIRYGIVFKDTTINSKWFKDTNLSLNNSAANYSFVYLLYRILNEIKPKNILEFGLGQTTKLTIQYANYFSNTSLQVIEDNQNWINTFLENNKINNNISINQCDLEEFEYDNSKNLRYKNLNEIIKNKKFDLIIIDGPKGWLQKLPLKYQEYPRSNIWELISTNLSEDFIIIFDDFDRMGEKNTSKITLDLLADHNIKAYSQEFNGLKHQLLICSEKNRFSTWY